MTDRDEFVRRWQAGWSISRGWTTVDDDNDGILTAARVETLTAYQLAYGCRTTVTAQVVWGE